MNNIILILIITFTKFISLLPRSLFTRNSILWKVLGRLMKRRKKIVEANINHCFKEKNEEWRNNLIEKTYKTIQNHTKPKSLVSQSINFLLKQVH